MTLATRSCDGVELTTTDRSRVERRRYPGDSAGDLGPGDVREPVCDAVQGELPAWTQVMDCDGVSGGRVVFGFGNCSLYGFGVG